MTDSQADAHGGDMDRRQAAGELKSQTASCQAGKKGCAADREKAIYGIHGEKRLHGSRDPHNLT